MAENRPRGREKHVTGESKGVHRRGEGLGSGPVGNAGGYQDRDQRPSGGGPKRARGKPSLLILILALLLGGGGGLGALLNGGLGGSGTPEIPAGLVTGFSGGGAVSSGWDMQANVEKLNTTVDPKAREKYTQILGNGRDTITIMVYMCGTDLESKNGMATSDLQEMLKATVGKSINLLVYTGGCAGWRNNVVSSQVNQIYQIRDGKLACLVENAGQDSMVKPETLTSFLQWGKKNYPANRNMLIFWDHGGGSLSGYGYDEKSPRSGSMTLSGIQSALKKADMTFDFIGFDACLMATTETALMLTPFADYLIASEETEPGVGWYYTNWLTELSQNPSKPTLDVGKRIVDDFVDVCAQTCRGQQTTLSVVDLAELEATLPVPLRDFSRATTQLIQDTKYEEVSTARNQAREFARSSRIDQVDLVHLAKNMGNPQGEALAQVLLSAVKYNRTSSNMTNAYGLSIYFPYQSLANVDKAVNSYKSIQMDEEYTRCIQAFASLEAVGQSASGGASSPLSALLGSGGGSSAGSELIGQMLDGLFSGSLNGLPGLEGLSTGFLSGRTLETQDGYLSYLTEHRLDSSQMTWTAGSDGVYRLNLTQPEWDLVHELELNLFYDDGQGYIDLGLDNVFDFDENGALLAASDRTWIAINGQPVAYYHLDTVDDGTHYTITGRVPALLNGDRVDLILVFDEETPQGYLAGARSSYQDGETDTVAKGVTALSEGDTLDFLCDYYAYDGTYQDSYYLGEPMTVTDNMVISNVDVGEGAVRMTYRLTDQYHQYHWTPALEF
ncbi:MAG: peptidase C11 [Oscillospiraceae bacterium]|nr:peptidase C11 [Oscillospiraceae bacterium]